MKNVPRRRMPQSCIIAGDYDEKYYRFDSVQDLGLAIESLSIAMPQVKSETSEPYGMNGSVDESEYIGYEGGFGQIFYNPRKIKIVFGVKDRGKYYYALDNYGLKNLLHGKVREITFADDPDYYYRGRLSITNWDPYAIIPHITVEMTAHPFKHSHSSADGGARDIVPMWGIQSKDLELQDASTATVNTISNGMFTIRGDPGAISVWKVTLSYEGRYVFAMERGSTDIRYGGRWELRDLLWYKMSPFGIENGHGETKQFYLVFYCDYTIDYKWNLPDVIDVTNDSEDVFELDVGEEPVYPVIYASHDNCLLVDVTQQKIVPLSKGTEQNFGICLAPGKHELCFTRKQVTATDVYSCRMWVQRGYL